MLAFLFYYALLAVWPLLLWPALRLKGWSRAWLLVAVLAGALATAHEVRVLTGPPAAIRLDILLIAMVLGVLYAGAAAVLFLRRRRKSAAVVGVVLVVVGGGMSYTWIEAGRESDRLTRVLYEGQALLFEAKFRSLDAYASYFRMFDARPTLHPVGHWENQGESYFTRLIVNPEGRAWAFYPCGRPGPVTECMYRSADPGIKPAGEAAERRWEIALVSPSGSPFVTVRIAQPDPERLMLEGMGEPTRFVKTPPPIDPAPGPARLSYLGPFVQVECRGRHAAVRQLWLWQEDARLYAIGAFETLLAGEHAGYVPPIVLGEGARRGDGWRFEWQHRGQDWIAAVVLEIPGAPDEVIELAPLTGKADWDHWFDTLLTGHFMAGDVPAC